MGGEVSWLLFLLNCPHLIVSRFRVSTTFETPTARFDLQGVHFLDKDPYVPDLLSCFGLINSLLGNSISGEKLYYTDLDTSTRKRKLMPEKYRKIFANKQIVCVEYQDITDSDEREIFQVSYLLR
jgi:hypothetical protein